MHCQLIKYVLAWFLLVAATGYAEAGYRELLEKADSLAATGLHDSALAYSQVAHSMAAQNDTASALVLMVIARRHADLGNLDSAGAYADMALSLNQELFGAESVPVAECRLLKASLLMADGSFAAADSLYSAAIMVFGHNRDQSTPQLIEALDGQGLLKMRQGDYVLAPSLFRKALKLCEETASTSDQLSRQIRRHLAEAYYEQGIRDVSYKMCRELVAEIEADEGGESLELAWPLEKMAFIERLYRAYEESEERGRRALRIRERALGPESEELIGTLLNLVHVCRQQEEYADAQGFAERCASLTRNLYGQRSLDYAQALIELGSVYLDMGQTDRAAPLCAQIAPVLDSASRGDDNDIAIWLERFSWRFRYVDPENCLKLGRRAVDIRRRVFLLNAPQLAETDALFFAQFTRRSAGYYLKSFLDVGEKTSISPAMAAEVVFGVKGMVSDEMFLRQTMIDTSDMVRIVSDSLKGVRQTMSELQTQGSIDRATEAGQQTLDSLEDARTRLEARLAQLQLDQRATRDRPPPTVEEVAAALPDKACLVEIFRFYCFTYDPDTVLPHYLALVIHGTDGVRAFQFLGRTDPIDSTIAAYCGHVLTATQHSGPIDELQPAYDSLASLLYEMIWRPLEPHLHDAETVLIAPDGPLSLVSFAGLVNDEGSYLVEQYTLGYVSAARDLLRIRQKESEAPGSGLLAIGDPDYDLSAEERAAAAMSPSVSPEMAVHTGISGERRVRNVRSRCEQVSALTVRPLPGTGSEIQAVRRAWAEQSSEPCDALVGRHATEDNLRRLLPRRRVLHLATHGFYYPAYCVPPTSPLEAANARETAGDSPLLRCGLFLAGSNLHGEGADQIGVHDGVVTAEEICNLDLRGFEWVVLSACETGLGELQTNEGVYGLRRAFEMAGARSVISSLWPVSDSETVRFINFLYSRLDSPVATVLREYQLETLTRLREHNYSTHPVSWAAFISSGDWR